LLNYIKNEPGIIENEDGKFIGILIQLKIGVNKFGI
jgi:hypothetical protein